MRPRRRRPRAAGTQERPLLRHSKGDAQLYKAPGEADHNRERNDCRKLFRRKLAEAGVTSNAEPDAIDAEVAALIDETLAAPQPDPAQPATDVCVPYRAREEHGTHHRYEGRGKRGAGLVVTHKFWPG